VIFAELKFAELKFAELIFAELKTYVVKICIVNFCRVKILQLSTYKQFKTTYSLSLLHVLSGVFSHLKDATVCVGFVPLVFEPSFSEPFCVDLNACAGPENFDIIN
jgi:hypothetical protein